MTAPPSAATPRSPGSIPATYPAWSNAVPANPSDSSPRRQPGEAAGPAGEPLFTPAKAGSSQPADLDFFFQCPELRVTCDEFGLTLLRQRGSKGVSQADLEAGLEPSRHIGQAAVGGVEFDGGRQIERHQKTNVYLLFDQRLLSNLTS